MYLIYKLVAQPLPHLKIIPIQETMVYLMSLPLSETILEAVLTHQEVQSYNSLAHSYSLTMQLPTEKNTEVQLMQT